MRKQRAERLRFAVNSLPPETQRAMLDGIKQNRIVTGANTDRRGGVCPMLAADRDAFSVTPLAEIFATAWDHYTGTSFVNVTRRAASERDLNVLRSMLETSIELDAGAAATMAVAVSEIRAGGCAQAAPPRPDLVEASRVLTAAARLEISRALEAAGQPPSTRFPDTRVESASRPAPAVEAVPAPIPAPSLRTVRPAARVQSPHPTPSPFPADSVRPAARVQSPPATRLAAPAGTPARAQSAHPTRAAASAGRPATDRAPATKTTAELDRERARAIIANQASTLRPRAWPRPADPEPRSAGQPSEAAPAPAAVPAPAPAPAPARSPQLGDRDRTRELQARSGWAWLRPFSSFEDYEQTLHDLGEMERGPRSDGPRDDGGHRHENPARREPSPAA